MLLKAEEKEIELILNIKKRIMIDHRTNIQNIKQISLDLFGQYANDFRFFINNNEVTNSNKMNLSRILEYHETNMVNITCVALASSFIPINYADENEKFRKNLSMACVDIEELKKSIASLNLEDGFTGFTGTSRAGNLLKKTNNIITETNEFINKFYSHENFKGGVRGGISNTNAKLMHVKQKNQSPYLHERNREINTTEIKLLQEENEYLKETIEALNQKLNDLQTRYLYLENKSHSPSHRDTSSEYKLKIKQLQSQLSASNRNLDALEKLKHETEIENKSLIIKVNELEQDIINLDNNFKNNLRGCQLSINEIKLEYEKEINTSNLLLAEKEKIIDDLNKQLFEIENKNFKNQNIFIEHLQDIKEGLDTVKPERNEFYDRIREDLKKRFDAINHKFDDNNYINVNLIKLNEYLNSKIIELTDEIKKLNERLYDSNKHIDNQSKEIEILMERLRNDNNEKNLEEEMLNNKFHSYKEKIRNLKESVIRLTEELRINKDQTRNKDKELFELYEQYRSIKSFTGIRIICSGNSLQFLYASRKCLEVAKVLNFEFVRKNSLAKSGSQRTNEVIIQIFGESRKYNDQDYLILFKQYEELNCKFQIITVELSELVDQRNKLLEEAKTSNQQISEKNEVITRLSEQNRILNEKITEYFVKISCYSTMENDYNKLKVENKVNIEEKNKLRSEVDILTQEIFNYKDRVAMASPTPKSLGNIISKRTIIRSQYNSDDTITVTPHTHTNSNTLVNVIENSRSVTCNTSNYEAKKYLWMNSIDGSRNEGATDNPTAAYDEPLTPNSIQINSKILKNSDYKSSKNLTKYKEKAIKISDGVFFIFRVYDKKSILRFDLENRRFNVIEFADFGNFEENYNSQGSIYLNNLNGLFIVTGKNHDLFYYFNYKSKTMIKLGTLNDNHTFGSLIYYERDNHLICLSGWHNRKVERYRNDELVSAYINSRSRQSLYNNETALKNCWEYLPEMRTERSECPYMIINEIELVAFFGYNCPRATYINTIEKLNLQNPLYWEELKFKNEYHLTTSLKSHSCIMMKGSIYFLGGFDGHEEKPIDEFIEYDVNEKSLKLIERKYPDIIHNHFYNFQNDSALVPYIDIKNRLHFAGFDENDQVHSIDTTMFNYDIFKFD